MATDFDLCGSLRRLRRSADLSQRDLAAAIGISPAAIGHAEAGRRDLPVGALSRAAQLAGMRLAILDGEGHEVVPMADGTVRDMGARRFPAHLDTRYSDEFWWHGPERYSRPQPWYTFDRRRGIRDAVRGNRGTPVDHQVPRPGDSPEDRRERRRAARRRRAADGLRRRLEAGDLSGLTDEFTCDCPPACEELDEGLRPVHTPECQCRCDID